MGGPVYSRIRDLQDYTGGETPTTGNYIYFDGTNFSTQAVDLTTLVSLAPATSARNVIQPTGDYVPLTLDGFSGQTTPLFRARGSTGTAFLTIGPPTLPGNDSNINWLNLTGTMPTVMSTVTFGASIFITGAGSSNFRNCALSLIYGAGYTGANTVSALDVTHQSAGTGANGWASGVGNYGMRSTMSSSTVGHNVGFASQAVASSVLNLGSIGIAKSATNSPALNVGSAGLALNATINVGGFFGLMGSAPGALSASAALVADNGASGALILQGRANGVEAFSVGSDGRLVTNPQAVTAAPLSSSSSVILGGVTTQFATINASFFSNTTINRPTYSFVGASVITDPATLNITGAPRADTNGTFTNSHGILIRSTTTVVSGTTINSYGLTCNAMSGASNNYAAQFLGGNVGFGLSAPLAQIHVQSGAVGTIAGILQGFSGQTASIFEARDSVGTAFLKVGPPTLPGDSTSVNWLNITGTMPSVLSATAIGVNITVTGAGSSNNQNKALALTYFGGYTGANLTAAADLNNLNAGTGVGGWVNSFANYGLRSAVTAATIGHNLGLKGQAGSSSVLNLGVLGAAFSATNTPALNVGTAGLALNATINVGGFFGLMNTAPSAFAVSAALVADNGATSSDIFRARVNGTMMYRIGGTGYAITNRNAAPADADLAAGEAAYWLDSTDGAAKFMVKAKSADGTLVTGNIPLA